MRAGEDLHIMGSGALIRSLSPLGHIDEYMLSIHPLVLGTGHRLFAEGFAPTRFGLLEATPTTTGVIVATYRQREQLSGDSNMPGRPALASTHAGQDS